MIILLKQFIYLQSRSSTISRFTQLNLFFQVFGFIESEIIDK